MVTGLVNAVISNQPHLKTRLATHAGRVFSIKFPVPANTSLTFRIDPLGRLMRHILTTGETEISPDLNIELLRWPKLPLTASQLKESVQISGYAALAETLADIAIKLDPRLGDFFQAQIGDIAAQRIDRLTDQIKSRLRQKLTSQ